MVDPAGELLGIALDRRVQRGQRAAQLLRRVPVRGPGHRRADEAIDILALAPGQQAHVLVMCGGGLGQRAREAQHRRQLRPRRRGFGRQLHAFGKSREPLGARRTIGVGLQPLAFVEPRQPHPQLPAAACPRQQVLDGEAEGQRFSSSQRKLGSVSGSRETDTDPSFRWDDVLGKLTPPVPPRPSAPPASVPRPAAGSTRAWRTAPRRWRRRRWRRSAACRR